MAKILKVPESESEWQLQFECPGCGYRHSVYSREGRPLAETWWDFNNDYDSPTLNPSILLSNRSLGTTCHSFIRNGMIQFLGDCTHSLKGQTVELPNIEL